MDIATELISEANIIPTALMVLVLLYWSLMIIGVVGLDMFDIDVDVDADLGVDADFGVDVDVDGNAATAGGSQVSGSATTGNDSFLRVVLDFFYLSDIPIVMVGSAFVFGYWASSLITNHYFNPEQTFTFSLVLLLPNLIMASLFMRVSMMPMVSVFRKSDPEDNSRRDLYGKVARVKSLELNEKFGQIELNLPGEPEILLNARSEAGQKLVRGDAVKIISYNQDDGMFLVELTKWELN